VDQQIVNWSNPMKARFCGFFLTGVLAVLASSSETQAQIGIWIGGPRAVAVAPPAPVAVYGGYYAPYGYSPYVGYAAPVAPVYAVPVSPAAVYPYGWYSPAPFWHYDVDD
jgi:hypothetical protein